MIQTAEVLEEEVEDLQSTVADGEESEFHSGKIYCANCIHCKLVPSKSAGEERYVLRVRCSAGKWKKKLGQEKLYKYCTITRLYLDYCDTYEEMGDTRNFIRELKKSLPEKDEFYVLFPNGEH
jgi:hypothetical protein